MRRFFLLVLLIGIGVWVYLHFYRHPDDAAAATHEPRLAKQGTFFVLEYVSEPGPHGMIGFEPGREVHFVRADQQKGLLVVSDGQYEIGMRPSQLTNDLDIAALARNGDESSQQQIKIFLEHERAVYEAKTRADNIKYARAMEAAASRLRGEAPPLDSSQAQPAQAAAPANNPYSYLSAPAR